MSLRRVGPRGASSQSKSPAGERGFYTLPMQGSLVVHEHGKQQNDREGNADQPKQRASSKAHVSLLRLFAEIKPCGVLSSRNITRR